MAKAKPAGLKEGYVAPDIRLQTDTGGVFRLWDLRGKNVVLYFYPRANTPGCTTEACEFRDASPSLAGLDAVVVGVSPDAAGPQSKFKAKFGLPFTLLCDVDRTAAAAYGVWKEKSMYGRKVMGIERTTFLIGKDGIVRQIFPKVKAKGHAAQVLQALSAL
ncbi:MAG: peroxiredoxin [Bryobacteraceae bacterium]